jgi:hypothetical protein
MDIYILRQTLIARLRSLRMLGTAEDEVWSVSSQGRLCRKAGRRGTTGIMLLAIQEYSHRRKAELDKL